MSQVKNLRAMFENKGEDSSPVDRGRSPAGFGQGTVSSSNSPRPLSRVRTSFVAIEKDGKMGLHRDTSHDSTASGRLPDVEIDPESAAATAKGDMASVPRRLFANSPIPDAAQSLAGTTKSTPSHDAAGIALDKTDVVKSGLGGDAQADPFFAKADPAMKEPSTRINSPPKADTPRNKSKLDGVKDDGKPVAARPTGSAKKTTTRPSGASSAPKDPLKSSVPARASTAAKRTETKSSAAKFQDKGPVRSQSTKATSATSGLKPSSSAPSVSSVSAKGTRDPDTGFVKPRPKSPTRPVKLPASLMAHTASSVSKGSDSRQSLSRQSGSLNPPPAAPRASSRASMSAVGGPAQTIRRQASTVNRQRPSLGPPPKKPAQEQHAPKRESHVDEGFLARMMRPTQSSSSKVHDKAPDTPPRKSGPRPSTSHTERSSAAGGSAKRPVRASGWSRDGAQSSQASDSFAVSENMDPRVLKSDSIDAAAARLPRSTSRPKVEHVEGYTSGAGNDEPRWIGADGTAEETAEPKAPVSNPKPGSESKQVDEPQNEAESPAADEAPREDSPQPGQTELSLEGSGAPEEASTVKDGAQEGSQQPTEPAETSHPPADIPNAAEGAGEHESGEAEIATSILTEGKAVEEAAPVETAEATQLPEEAGAVQTPVDDKPAAEPIPRPEPREFEKDEPNVNAAEVPDFGEGPASADESKDEASVGGNTAPQKKTE